MTQASECTVPNIGFASMPGGLKYNQLQININYYRADEFQFDFLSYLQH